MSQLTPFIELVRKSHKVAVVIGVIVAVFGAGLLFIPAKTDKDLYIKIGLMAFFGLVAGGLLIGGLRAPEKAHGIRVLAERAHEIVWIYVVRRTRNGQHIASSLQIGLLDGKKATLPLALGRENELQDLAGTFAPGARLGYDPKLEAQFKQDPASLRDGVARKTGG